MPKISTCSKKFGLIHFYQFHVFFWLNYHHRSPKSVILKIINNLVPSTRSSPGRSLVTKFRVVECYRYYVIIIIETVIVCNHHHWDPLERFFVAKVWVAACCRESIARSAPTVPPQLSRLQWIQRSISVTYFFCISLSHKMRPQPPTQLSQLQWISTELYFCEIFLGISYV